ncbi:MAG: HD domain-containing protein [Syntrophaceae bacterium]|nr:HD domain-containing protein [Syntrophaceae bacterium]
MKRGNIKKEGQDSLPTWFKHYTDRFLDQNGVLHPLLELKRCHSLRVAGNARFIAEVLKFPESDRRLAEGAGLVHDVGRFTQYRKRTDIPCGLSAGQSLFLCLIRDADKLDIMELVLRAVVIDGFQDLPEMLPHVRLSRELSPGALVEAVKTKSVSNGNLSTLADFLVMMATWCYDINYTPTRCLAIKRGILPRIRRELPDTNAVRALFAGITKELLKNS